MESLSPRRLSFLASSTTFPLKYPKIPVRNNLRLVLCYKKYNFQDFQEYAKPSRLLPATEVNVCKDTWPEKKVSSFETGRSDCLYRVKLKTSNIYGSDLSDSNSGVLICLIDEYGDSILQMLPSCSMDKPMHFQRGSVDEFAFEGPQLGKIVAVWISVESGQWRIADLNLTIISHREAPSANNEQKSKKHEGLQYNFTVEDILLGEGSEMSMIQFKPHSDTAFSRDQLTFLNTSLSHNRSNYTISNQESMKEYADLKFSLLFYNGLLIVAGSLIASFLSGENASFAFITGGIGGFLYLLFLQRSVDELPVPQLVSRESKGNFSQVFGRFKRPLTSFAVAFALAIVMVKYAAGDGGVKLTPKDLIFGMMGFLLCKVSVVLAAFKPMSIGTRDSKW